MISCSRFRLWQDLAASRAQVFIGELRGRGLSAQTRNFYCAAIKQFARWMVRDRRAPENPVAHLSAENVRRDRRHDRRALSLDEVRKLIATARRGPERFGMNGTERALLYQLAVTTGIRASEIRSLTWAAVDLDRTSPTVIVRAAYSKSGREDCVPLMASTARALAKYRALLGDVEPQAKLFPNMPNRHRTPRMIKANLEAAGIPYSDETGRYADFHSLRHTCGTWLAAVGAHPKVIQRIMRHSTITLTMDRYTHAFRADEAAALAKLPDLSSDAARPEPQRATGTCDTAPAQHGSAISSGISNSGASRCIATDTGCTEGSAQQHDRRREGNNASADETGTSRSPLHRNAPNLPNGEGGIRTPEGFRPTGFQDRRLQPLGHLSFQCRLGNVREWASRPVLTLAPFNNRRPQSRWPPSESRPTRTAQ
jgi:integrase